MVIWEYTKKVFMKKWIDIKNNIEIYFIDKKYNVLGERKQNSCPSCDSSIIVQIEEEPLPSIYSTSNLKQSSEVENQNLTEEENSNESTPVNSRSSKTINVIIYFHNY